MMAQLSGESSSGSYKSAHREDARDVVLQSKHKIFLSHSGAQKDFVEQLCVDLEGWDAHPFFDKHRDSLPIGENFPQHIFEAIGQCEVGVVILSEEFLTRSKWPMIELVAMVREAKKKKKREVGLKIVPVFLGMSICEFQDGAKRSEWQAHWEGLALKDDRIDVQEWEDALKYLERLNSMVYDGLGEVKFRKEIVDVLCGAVPLETRLEDSHIQGRSRLCKVIQERIDVVEHEKSEGVVVVGLYGVGGIGKSSICKALCNEYVVRFHGRVCHAELERKSKEELLREVLKRLSDTSHELLDRWNEDELLTKLHSGMIKEPVFLAVDNVFDGGSMDEAKQYVLARLPKGSIVMVTSRSRETLKLVSGDLVDKRVMEMPELDVEEARSLFCKSYEMKSGCKIDERVIKRCVEQCHFSKGDGNGNKHYHPLTLDVLGKQLACVDAKDWEAYLGKMDQDIFNGSREVEQQVFSILRESYDLLPLNDQLLFMDVALFLPSPMLRRPYFSMYKLSTYEWLGMVHEISVDDVVCGLKRLRRKSLLENLGDGMGKGIGMHDLWRAFCKAEGQSSESRCGHWLNMAKGNMEIIGRHSRGGCWENVARMAFVGVDLRDNLERMNLSPFYSVTVLKILKHDIEKELLLDLSGLQCLKSLDIVGRSTSKLVLVGLPRNLVFIRVTSLRCLMKLAKEVGYLTKLEHLQLVHSPRGKLLDMGNMVSLRVAIFYMCQNVVTVTGLGTKLSNLRVLHLIYCEKLRICPGVGNLVGLEDLNFLGCPNLKRLPNLGKMRNLRKLVVSSCPLITEVPGLGDLVALEELHGGQHSHLCDPCMSLRFRLPDMSKLKKLRVMRLRLCGVDALSGLDCLVSLEELEVDFRVLVEKPSLRQLTKLQTLRIPHGWLLQGLNELNNLAMLRDLRIGGCFNVDYLPDIQGLVSLQTLRIEDCGFKGVGGLSNLIAVESLEIESCGMLERVPDLQRLTRLETLRIEECRMLKRWDRTVGAVEGSSCRSISNDMGLVVPDFGMLSALRTLLFSDCPVFDDVLAIGASSSLEGIFYWHLDAIVELPDLSCFPRLKFLSLRDCGKLRRLTVSEPIHSLTDLEISRCSSLMALPELSSFPGLVRLCLSECRGISRLGTSEPLRSLQLLDFGSGWVSDACGVKELPDLGMFPALVSLLLGRCDKLTSMRSSVPLTALRFLDARGCTGLSGADLDELQALCAQCEITRDASDVERDVVLERSRFQRILGCLRS